jgi:hypothetical protein
MRSKLVVVALVILTSFVVWQNSSVVRVGASRLYCELPPEDCHGPASPATMHKAWEMREAVDGDCTSSHCYGLDASDVLSERWANAQKDVYYFPRTQDVISVELNKTNDGGEWTVTLIDPDGRRATFWLRGGNNIGGKVRAITPY